MTAKSVTTKVVRIERLSMDVKHSIRIGHGQYGHEMLSLVMLNGEYPVIIQHKPRQFPKSSDYDGRTSGVGNNWLWHSLTEEGFAAMNDAMNSWQANKDRSMVSYTYLFAYLKARGFDFHKDYQLM